MNLRLGVKNFLLVGVMAVIFIALAKVISTKYPNPTSPIIMAV